MKAHKFSSDFSSGRGYDHPSAFLEEGDLVTYVTGTWKVDGVDVGKVDAKQKINAALITCTQLVFTHNCEHGYLYGLALDLKEIDDGGGRILVERDSAHVDIQFGPEQLVSKIDATICTESEGWVPRDPDLLHGLLNH